MCDSLPAFSAIKFRSLRCFPNYYWRPNHRPILHLSVPNCSKFSNASNSDDTDVGSGGLSGTPKPNIRVTPNISGRSENNRFYGELGFEEKEFNHLDLESNHKDSNLESVDEHFTKLNANVIGSNRAEKSGSHSSNATASSGLDFLEFKDDLEGGKRDRKSKESLAEENDFIPLEGTDLLGEEELKRYDGKVRLRRKSQLMRRSNMLAKQVISIQSALSLGFISQLWVEIATWTVLFVEVRSTLLSGESEWFLLEDVSKVGDVVLVQDESVVENDFKMIGLETLVGYKVVTPGRRCIGKVRGYTFNINSGAVESLELDSFGISVIPSSLVSTYALLVEDVLEVVSDVVIVHEAAASRIQRLTKGFLGTQTVGTESIEELNTGFERPIRSDHNWSIGRNYGTQKFQTNDDWELPMDYM